MHAFILSAIDVDQLYPYLCTRFETDDLAKLHRVISADDQDPEINATYTLDVHEATTLCEAFGIAFDVGNFVVELEKDTSKLWSQIPYLVHTGYELPLLLQGRKMLAFEHFDSEFPYSMAKKARYDHYVAEGLLSSDEKLLALPQYPGRQFIDALYTPKGEEWRMEAHRLIYRAFRLSGGWNEHYERLQGMLMGYENWQNDWWQKHCAITGTPWSPAKPTSGGQSKG